VKKCGKKSQNKDSDKLSECMAKLKILRTVLMNQKYFQEEIKSSLDPQNVRYFLHQNCLFSGLLPKNMKINIYQNCAFCFACVLNLVSHIEGII
jgi:hypothetical protein